MARRFFYGMLTAMHPHRSRFKILLLSAGSHLGQNLLDVLESRRHLVEVTGLNSEAENSQLFRCDQAYLMPQLNQREAFGDRLLALLEQHQPDLILPGRDDDVVFLAEFRQAHPAFAPMIPCGPAAVAHIARDKFATWQWAQAQQLPFAESFVCSGSEQLDALHAFVERVGFPLIAKPRKGFGSLGVYVATHWPQVEKLSGIQDLVFQEYLDPPELQAASQRYQSALPLFFEIPEDSHYTAQTLITPSGQLSEVFCSLSRMVRGRDEWYRRIRHAELEDLLKRYAAAFYQAGWVGPLNLQCKPDRQGQWKAYEVNLRFSGGTSCRLKLGYDEVGRLIRTFYPATDFPDHSLAEPVAGQIQRVLQDRLIPDRDLAQLQTAHCWSQTAL
ncbi:MAG: hypothetical protein CVV27_04980 [Candidatus Melainabacteria bacterium HGW-Melainabacteria-1]|nr:MAG: hypothetical protein CVV27_04980 [Candidatus Melainabacteria bacterium HGW-Melainabacteria-1]